jgi:hypothetical protein
MLGVMPGSVLVVDDGPVFGGVGRRILAAVGLEVEGSADSAAVAKSACALRPDALPDRLRGWSRTTAWADHPLTALLCSRAWC